MITRIHQQVADLTIQASEAWGQQKQAKAVCLVLAARVLAVALLALNALTIVLTPLRYLIQSFIVAHYARKAPFVQGAATALGDWCKADLALQFIGIIQSLGSILSPELFCLKFKLQKQIYHQAIKMDTTILRLSDKDLEEFKRTTTIAGFSYDQQKYEALFQEAWQKNALEANTKSAYGQPDVQTTLSKTLSEVGVRYFQNQKMQPREYQKCREKMQVQILELVTKTEKLTPAEEVRLEILGKIEPRAYNAAKLSSKVTPNKPKPVATPATQPAQTTPIDPMEFARKLQEEENEAAARRIQEEQDAQTALDFMISAHLHGQSGGKPKPPPPIKPSGAIPKGMYGNAADFDRILKVDSMQTTDKKHLDKHDKNFSEELLECMKEARTEIVKKKFFTDDEIASYGPEGMYAVWNVSVFNFYSSSNQNSCKVPIWKAPNHDALIATMNKQNEALKNAKDTYATGLLCKILKDGKTPDLEKELEAFRKSNKKTAKLVDSLEITVQQFKEIKEIVSMQKELKDVIEKFEALSHYDIITPDGQRRPSPAKDLLFDKLAHNGETKESAPKLKELEKDAPQVAEGLNAVYKQVNEVIGVYQKRLFNNNGIVDGVNWFSALDNPNDVLPPAAPAKPAATKTQPASTKKK